MGKLNYEVFELIERRGGITVDELVKKLGIKKSSAATYLSKWTNYMDTATGTRKHYLVHEGRHYRVGPDWWGERYFSSSKPPLEEICSQEVESGS